MSETKLQQRKLTRLQIKVKALEIFNSNTFKASKMWMDKFLQEFDIKFKVLTILQNNGCLNKLQQAKFNQEIKQRKEKEQETESLETKRNLKKETMVKQEQIGTDLVEKQEFKREVQVSEFLSYEENLFFDSQSTQMILNQKLNFGMRNMKSQISFQDMIDLLYSYEIILIIFFICLFIYLLFPKIIIIIEYLQQCFMSIISRNEKYYFYFIQNMLKQEDINDVANISNDNADIIDFDQYEQEDVNNIEQNIQINNEKPKEQFLFIIDEERKENRQRENSIVQFQEEEQDNIANFGSVHREDDFMSWKDENKQSDQNDQEQFHQICAMTERQKDENIMIKELDLIVDMNEFLNKSIEQHHQIQLTLVKDTSGTNKFHPKFLLYFSQNKQFLCSAKRIAFSQQTHYVISQLQDKFERKHKSCLGKIKGQGGIFKLYDTGDNPKNAKFLEKVRKELCMTYFQSSKLVGQVRQSIIIPRVINGQPIEFKPLNDTDGLLKAFYSLQHKDQIQHFVSKTAAFNKQKQKYELQFTDRVTIPSIKNCIIEDINNTNKNKFVLQFGKCSKQTFQMDICHPLSILQGLSICVSQFERKK